MNDLVAGGNVWILGSGNHWRNSPTLEGAPWTGGAWERRVLKATEDFNGSHELVAVGTAAMRHWWLFSRCSGKIQMTVDFPGSRVDRNRLPLQGTQVRSLAWEDSTCHRATKCMCHNYWACTRAPMCLEPMRCNKRSHGNKKPRHCNKE